MNKTPHKKKKTSPETEDSVSLKNFFAVAFHYQTISDWRHNHPEHYRIAIQQGLLEECTSHMKPPPPRRWDLESCLKDASLYKSKKEWKDASGSAYRAALRSGWMEECSAHMENKFLPKGHWNFETCLEDARNFSTVKDWLANTPSAYKKAAKYGWLKECTKHMNIPECAEKGYWNPHRCMTSALRFSSPMDWYKNDRKAYLAAGRLKILKACNLYMKKQVSEKRRISPSEALEEYNGTNTEVIENPPR
jgi:hypothetical protein